MSNCGICGRQVEVSDSGQAMPCACIKEPLGGFLRGVLDDCIEGIPAHPCICEFVIDPARCRARVHAFKVEGQR